MQPINTQYNIMQDRRNN